MGKTIAPTTLYDLANLPHLTMSIKLIEQNTTHKPITWWDHVRASAYMPIPGLDARGVTPELKLRLKFYCSWTLWGFFWFFFLFVCYIIVGFLFLFLFLFSFFFLYYQLHHHYLLIPTLTLFTLPPSPVLQSIALLPNYSFCPISSALSPCPHIPLPSSTNLSPYHPSLLHTHHLLTNLLYQLYTNPNPCNPWHNHPTLQQKCTQTYNSHKT
jgi:hypothetical protein